MFKRLAIVLGIFSLTFFSHSIKVEEIRIINFTNIVSQNPFFVLEVFLGEESEQTHEEDLHKHDHVFFEISLGKHKKKYVLGESLLFERVGENKVRVFVPPDFRLDLGKNYSLGVRVLEDGKVIFSKSFTFSVSNVPNVPYLFTNNLRNVFISRVLTNSHRFFYYYNKPLKVKVLRNGEVLYSLKSFEDVRFRGLYYFDCSFSDPGEYRFSVGEVGFNVFVSFDNEPPRFEVFYPTNNSVFYRTNKIFFKWSDPIDSVGVDKLGSYLKVYYEGKLITNVVLVNLNKESAIMPYEFLVLDLPEEGKYVSEISYRDFDGNVTNVIVNFSVDSSQNDKEIPKILNVYFEGAKLVDNKVKLPKRGRVWVNVNVSDGVYGSGIKRVVHSYGGEVREELVFGDFVQFFVDVTNDGIFEIFCEDFSGNRSDTLRYGVVVE